MVEVNRVFLLITNKHFTCAFLGLPLPLLWSPLHQKILAATSDKQYIVGPKKAKNILLA